MSEYLENTKCTKNVTQGKNVDVNAIIMHMSYNIIISCHRIIINYLHNIVAVYL